MIAHVPDRLMDKIMVLPDTCWLWLGARTVRGYGHLSWNGRHSLVHRVVYEEMVGPIPEGLTIDHRCFVIDCCNPDHLEPVTMRENLLRARARQTHCYRGHEFTPENTYLYLGKSRRCRACARDRGYAAYWQNRTRKNRSHRRVMS